MAQHETKQLLKCLSVFPADVQERALWIRDFIWEAYPDANELIYDNYNAVAVGWSPTDRVGHIFASFACGRTSHNVHFGFYYGARLKDPRKLLVGEGNQYRYILLKDTKTFPAPYVRKLLKEAHKYSLSLVKDQKQIQKGLTIFKSASKKKRVKKKGAAKS